MFAAARIRRVLWNDPASGVMRHADAGYEDAIACAREHGLNLPFLGGDAGGLAGARSIPGVSRQMRCLASAEARSCVLGSEPRTAVFGAPGAGYGARTRAAAWSAEKASARPQN